MRPEQILYIARLQSCGVWRTEMKHTGPYRHRFAVGLKSSVDHRRHPPQLQSLRSWHEKRAKSGKPIRSRVANRSSRESTFTSVLETLGG